MEIIRGRQSMPVKAVVYGVEGIGKTTFASKWEKPLFIDVEKGSSQIDISRVLPNSFSAVKECISSLTSDAQEFKTIVIDSIDRVEQMIVKSICIEAGINCIEKYEKGWGKGWKRVAQEIASLLDSLDRLRLTKGVNILLIGHSALRRIDPADMDSYDIYTLTNQRGSAEIIKDWSDLTLFARYDTFTVKNENNRNKISGSNKRIMYSRANPCWDAKSRYDLPEKMPFEFDAIKSIFSTQPSKEVIPTSPPPSDQSAKSDESEFHEVDPPPSFSKEEPKRELLPQYYELQELLSTSGYTEEDLQRVIEKKGMVPVGTPVAKYNEKTLIRITSNFEAVKQNMRVMKGK